MKSRISIDVDYDNQPIIKIEYSPSEDVRDKLVKKFFESFGGQSTWANFYFSQPPLPDSKAIFGQSNSQAVVRPIHVHELKDHVTPLKYMVQEHEKMLLVNNGPVEVSESEIVEFRGKMLNAGLPSLDSYLIASMIRSAKLDEKLKGESE